MGHEFLDQLTSDQVSEQAEHTTPEPLPFGAADTARLLAVLERHEQQIGRRYAGAALHERVDLLCTAYHVAAVSSLAQAMSFRNDLLTYFRAMSLVVEMAGNAATHTEKNARLRGMSEILESAVERLRQQDFEVDRYHWSWPDVFRSDYPTRHFLSRIHELERELAQYRRSPQDGQAPSRADDVPF